MNNSYDEINFSEWYRLDNAAKIFPVVSGDKNPNVFRISATLYESVDKDLLQQALETALTRFPSYAVKLRRGFFWFFLDHNTNKPKVKEENPNLFSRIKPVEENGYLFRVSYYGNRISLEMFHSLSDGFGGFEFLKSILFHYLELKKYDVKGQNIVKMANSPYQLGEIEDSFNSNYEKGKLYDLQDEKAYVIPGISFVQGGSGFICGECNATDFKNLAKSYGATVGELIIANYVYSVIQANPLIYRSNKPISIFVPVNLRRFFNSQSLRNFTSFAKVKFSTLNKIYTFEEIIEGVKQQMKEQINKETLTRRMSGGVSAERSWFLRLVPLFLKVPVLKFYYKLFGSNTTTTSISNMGKVELPESMLPYVDKLDFSFGGSNTAKINVGVGSFNNKLTICMCRSIMETNIERLFFTNLSDKIKFKITTNSWEEDNFAVPIQKEMLSKKEKKQLKKDKKAASKLEKKAKKVARK